MKLQRTLLLFLIINTCISSGNNHIEHDFLRFFYDRNKIITQRKIIDFNNILWPAMHVQAYQDGNYMLIEGERWIIHLFYNQNNSATELGGLGNGPCEFSIINHTFLSEDGELLLLDLRQQRVTVMDLSGLESELFSIVDLPSFGLRIEKKFPLSNGIIIGVFREYPSDYGDEFE